jgi:hypothetical protein
VKDVSEGNGEEEEAEEENEAETDQEDIKETFTSLTGEPSLQGYLTHKKTPSPRTLQ